MIVFYFDRLFAIDFLYLYLYLWGFEIFLFISLLLFLMGNSVNFDYLFISILLAIFEGVILIFILFVCRVVAVCFHAIGSVIRSRLIIIRFFIIFSLLFLCFVLMSFSSLASRSLVEGALLISCLLQDIAQAHLYAIISIILLFEFGLSSLLAMV